tara:strand:- start:680 stop:1444 length:765 start_codon:yes stop_codon:yes gene_type:complete
MILSSVIIGAGPTIIILHGLFGEGKNWFNIAKELSSDYELHLIDQRNHGNTFHDINHDYNLLAGDLYNYIQHHNLISYSIIGHSMGGKVAMQFALQYPHYLKKLIIVDIAPRKYIDDHAVILQGLNKVLLYAKSRKDAFSILFNEIQDTSVTHFLLKGLYFKSINNQPQLKFNLKSLEVNNDNLLKAIKADCQYIKPIYFLRGDNSTYITDLDVKYIASLFPYYNIITIKNAGHWVHYDNKVEFISVVNKLLKY